MRPGKSGPGKSGDDCINLPHLTSDKDTVELCGALKNIVAVAAGFIDGLGLGELHLIGSVVL